MIANFKLLAVQWSKTVRSNIRSPWQNGTAERWVGSARRELPPAGEGSFRNAKETLTSG
jgi:hypothetical protein